MTDPRINGLKNGIYEVDASEYPIHVTGVYYPTGELTGYINVLLGCECCTEAEPLEDYNFAELSGELKEEIITKMIIIKKDRKA